MKTILLTLFLATILYSAAQTERINVANVYQANVIDLLDPSWPKLA